MSPSNRISEIDTRFGGVEHAICCHRAGDDVLIDPGPAISIDTVVEALGGATPRAVLLTHIHLDHAGGTGELVRRFPQLTVHVHADAAPYIVDPERLLASATRVFGELEPQFGVTLPVPAANIRPLADGDVVEGFEALHTPGHAGTHLAFIDTQSGIALAGDVAGERIPGSDFVLPPTPPPEIDVDLWLASIERLAARRPTALGLAHYGRVDDPAEHLERTAEALRRDAEHARTADQDAHVAYIERRIDQLPAAVRDSFRKASPPYGQFWVGLDRYWSKRAR